MGQITCTCIDCNKTKKFKNELDAKSNKWHIWCIEIKNDDYYASCPTCDNAITTQKANNTPIKVEKKLINSDIIAYD